MVNIVITDAGINTLPQVAAGAANPWTHVALGTGTTDPVEANTALETEVYRAAATVTYAGSVATFKLEVAAGVITADITEIGIFNAAAGGTMYYREVRGAVPLSATQGAIFKVQVPFTRSTDT